MGHALLQLSYHYYTVEEDNFKNFLINPKPKVVNPDEMHLDICFEYQQTDGSITNMLIMEANLPSGFMSSNDYRTELLDNEIINRIESKNSETTIIIYFQKIPADTENCVYILADKIIDVTNRKPASIVVYDYYNISRYDTVFYRI